MNVVCVLTERHEQPVEGRVGVDSVQYDDGDDVAGDAEHADDEQRDVLQPELSPRHEQVVLIEALVALVLGLCGHIIVAAAGRRN